MTYKPTHGDVLTIWLRNLDWTPPMDLPCGCTPVRLCEGHRDLRAVEHYHPEFALDY